MHDVDQRQFVSAAVHLAVAKSNVITKVDLDGRVVASSNPSSAA